MTKPTKQEIDDLRNQKKIDEAYEKSLRNTEMAPATVGKDEIDKMFRDASKELNRRKSTGEPFPQMPRAYAKGGKVNSASKRADGCAERGKTKGTMIKMG